MEPATSPARIESLLAHREWVRRLARSLVADEGGAADIEQEVWLSALARPPAEIRAPRGWLATALRHAASNRRRGESRRGRRERGAARPEAEPATVDLVAEAETQRRLVDAVLALEEPYRGTVLLRWFDDLPPRTIAERQGIPEETVRTRLRRALGRLRERLDREGGGDRRAWALALLPLARRAEGAAAPAAPFLGGLLMTMKAKAGIAAAAVALLALLGWLALGGGDGGRAAPAADPEAGKPDVAVAPAAPPPAPPAPPPEEPAPPAPAVEPPAPAPRTGTIVVRLVDRGTGKAVKGIGVSFSGPGVGYRQRRAEGDSMEEVLDLTPGVEQETVTVTILPEGTSVALSGPPLSRSVVVAPGARVEAEFEWSPPPEIRGRILAADGTPVEGALVFLGEQVLARGDEPFKPFDEKRVPQAVRTDASGEFALRGHGRVVTAWHATHSPVTVPVASVGEIRLPARGTVRGRLVDAAGAPVAGIEVALDRTRKATTDGEGRFSFDAVEAGVRGLLLPKKRYIALRVAPGETSEFEVGPGLPEVRVGIRKDGKPIAGPLRGALVGLDRVASVHDVKVADGAFTLSGVLPGRFLLVTMSGPIAFVDVRGPTATVELGAAALTVKAPAGTSVALAPAESDFLVDLMAMRVGHRRGAGGVGVDPLVFLDLPDGAYRILVEDPPGSGRKAGEVPVVIEGGKDATVDLSTAK